VAGFDQHFKVRSDDAKVALACLKVWKHTCARHSVELELRRKRRSEERHVTYELIYNLSSPNIHPALNELILEMRAISAVQQGKRARRVPLRLMRDTILLAIFPIEEQLEESSLVPNEKRQAVTKLLQDYELTLAAFRKRSIAPADFLEAQHSLANTLALNLADGANHQDKFPSLIDRLRIPNELKDRLKRIGNVRNIAKHRNERDAAEGHVFFGMAAVAEMVERLTGAWLDAVSNEALEIYRDPTTALRSLPTYWRSGQPRRMRR
jgi:hypothetical protein